LACAGCAAVPARSATPDETQALNDAIQQAVGPSQVSSPGTISSPYPPASQVPLTDPSGLTTPAAPAASAEPDWTTQLAFTFRAADPRLIQPYTPVDTGNRYLNAVVNSFVLSWGNVLKLIDNVPYSIRLGLGDLAERYQQQLQPINDLGPLAGSWGLAVEIGPALEATQAWLSTNQTVRGIATAPAFWAVGADGLGGGIGRLPPLGPQLPDIAGNASEELPALGPTASSALQGRLLKADLAAQHIQDAERVGAGSLADRAAWGQVLNQAKGLNRYRDSAHFEVGSRLIRQS